eukprot:scaffold117829_cov47-Phaeocystis_antarctica.AAC.1
MAGRRLINNLVEEKCSIEPAKMKDITWVRVRVRARARARVRGEGHHVDEHVAVRVVWREVVGSRTVRIQRGVSGGRGGRYSPPGYRRGRGIGSRRHRWRRRGRLGGMGGRCSGTCRLAPFVAVRRASIRQAPQVTAG